MTVSQVLDFSSKVCVLPVIHGSGDFAVEVRRAMLNNRYDCLAVPLPASFQYDVEQGVRCLPEISAVVQREAIEWRAAEWSPDASESAVEDEDELSASYVPIDPCQGVIAALRIALQENIPRAFIDLETAKFRSEGHVFPDPYALKKVSAELFATAVLPGIPVPAPGQPRDRIRMMSFRLRELERRYSKILFVCSLSDWPYLRDAYREASELVPEDESVEGTERLRVDPRTLTFFLSELPFVTGLYERARATLDDDENLSIDGIKALLIASRELYRSRWKSQARSITPKLFSTLLKYVRNLTLMDRRLSPELYSLAIAAQQVCGDQFAIAMMEVAKLYQPTSDIAGNRQAVGDDIPVMQMGVRKAMLRDQTVLWMHNRLPGPPVSWRTMHLKPTPPKPEQGMWQARWNPFTHCSWPPEDIAIEKFRTHVKEAALAMLGADLARTEKFTTSLKDGLDIRETLRNWHTGSLHVKVLPPSRGSLDCVVMLFDSPADPRDYPWRVTWHAEHHDESTLALFASNYFDQMVGPGIGQATYGGGMFLFPPRPIRDIWTDPKLEFTDTLEERLLAAACLHARERHIGLLSSQPPGVGWRMLAKRYGKKLLHIPLNRFNQETIQQIRTFHVLNGKSIRSYAAQFIRKA